MSIGCEEFFFFFLLFPCYRQTIFKNENEVKVPVFLLLFLYLGRPPKISWLLLLLLLPFFPWTSDNPWPRFSLEEYLK